MRKAILVAMAGLLGAGLLTGPAHADTGTCPRRENYCLVNDPNVSSPLATYQNINFYPGDKFVITAGGCVQTGGGGLTWKRYVDPSSDNGEYHGLISVAGVPGLDSPTRLLYVANQGRQFTASRVADLALGYEDDDYSDNGYWSHDAGSGGQCANVGDAWVRITFV
jgi:hypothetical protein